MHRVHVTIRGRVQGVGFRHFAYRRSRELGLTGWVSNRSDGAVEVEAEGSRESIESLLADLRVGPTGARVVTIEDRWTEGTRRNRSFEIMD